VLRDHGITIDGAASQQNCVDLNGLSGSDNPAVTRVQDWLQAGESDLEFLQRLATKAHIFFFFKHYARYHQVVYSNRASYLDALPDGRRLRYTATDVDALGNEQDDLVTEYRYAQTLTATGVDSVLLRQQAAWEQDTVAVFNTWRAQSAEQLGSLPFRRFQACQYGGSDAEVRWDNKACDQNRSAAATSLSASTLCPMLRPGFCLTLDDASSVNVQPHRIRPTLGLQRFVVTSVQHESALDGNYRNQIEATEAEGQVAGFSLSDTQQGSVVGQVVRHDNGEEPQDWRYYQRSAYDPEQDKLLDRSANPQTLRPKGVYVRFATDAPGAEPVWIKLAPHMLTVPELGVSVVVTRASDHSELPEIQSIVQNNGHLTVTPSGWTANSSVGNNYSTSYGDSCSVRFSSVSPDTLPDAKSWVDNKYQSGKSDYPGWFSGAHLRDVSWSQGASSSYSTSETGRQGVLSESISIGSTYSQHDGNETRSTSDVNNSWSEQTVHQDSFSRSRVVGTSTSISSTGISVNSSESGISNSNSAIGISNSNSSIATSNNNSVVGVSIDISAVGASTRSSVTGASNDNSAVGASLNNSLVGTSSSNSITGSTSSLSVVGSSNDMSVHTSQTSIQAITTSMSITRYGSGFRVSNDEVLDTAMKGLSLEIFNALKVFM